MVEDASSAAAKLRLAGGKLDDVEQARASNLLAEEEIANYIGDMLQELRDLARSGGLGSLAALLEIAVHEAKKDTTKPPNAGQGK